MASIFDKIVREKRIEHNRVSENIELKKTIDEVADPIVPKLNYDLLKKKQKDVADKIENSIAKKKIKNVNKYFDSELIKNLDIFYDFMKSLDSSIKPYYSKDEDGKIDVDMRAYLDAKDFLINEFGLDVSNLHRIMNDKGVVNGKKFFITDGYSIDGYGIVRHFDEIVYDPDKAAKIRYIDYNKEIAVVEPGIYVDISDWKDEVYKKLILENNNITNKNSTASGIITGAIDTDDFKDITGKDLNSRAADIVRNPEDYMSKSEGDDYDINYCNWESLNFLWLMFLIICGGGKAGTMPLSSSEEGEIGWNCQGLSGTTTFKTGHPWMYTESRKLGLPTSLIQMLYSSFSPIYGVNINVKIVKWRWKMCVGGWVEYAILSLQLWFSSKLKDMKCKANKMTVDIDGKTAKDRQGISFGTETNIQDKTTKDGDSN